MSKTSMHRKRILIVDDEKEIVAFLENFLKRLKITSEYVTTGEAALSIYDKSKFDMVFLDINLKGINGLQVLEDMRKNDPGVRAIMITGKAEKEVQLQAKHLGALDYVTKPLDLGDLKETIGRHI